MQPTLSSCWLGWSLASVVKSSGVTVGAEGLLGLSVDAVLLEVSLFPRPRQQGGTRDAVQDKF